MRSDQDLGHCDKRLSLLAVASALPSSQHAPSAPCLASQGPCIPSSQGTLVWTLCQASAWYQQADACTMGGMGGRQTRGSSDLLGH